MCRECPSNPSQRLRNDVVQDDNKKKAESIPSDTKAVLCASLKSSSRCFLREKPSRKQNTKQQHVISTEMSFSEICLSCFFLFLPPREDHFVGCYLFRNFLSLFDSAARTRITTPPQDQSVIKGTKAIMTCGVTHDPSVTVR